MPRTRKYSRTAFFAHSFTTQPPSVGLGHADLAAVEQPDGLLDGLGVDVPVLGREARLDRARPAPRELRRSREHLPSDEGAREDRRRRARSPRASAPSPSGRSPRPRARRTIRARRRCRARAAPAPTPAMGGRRARATHRYMPATLPATSTPCRREELQEDARAWPRTARRCSWTWISSPQAATDARWTNSCGVTPRRGPERLQRRDQLRVARHEPGAITRHVGALAEGVQHDDVREVAAARSPDAGGPSSNHSSLYASSSASRKSCRRASVGGPLQERERRDGAGRVVRVVEPQDRRALPRVRSRRRRGPGRKSGAAQREAQRRRPPRTARRARGSCSRARSRATRSRPAAGSSTACASEKIGSLLPSVGIRSRRGIERHVEPPPDPADDRPRAAPADRPRAGTRRWARSPSRSASRMNAGGLVARVTDTEVDQLAPGVERLRLAPVELLERVRLRVPDPRRQLASTLSLPPSPRGTRRSTS